MWPSKLLRALCSWARAPTGRLGPKLNYPCRGNIYLVEVCPALVYDCCLTTLPCTAVKSLAQFLTNHPVGTARLLLRPPDAVSYPHSTSPVSSACTHSIFKNKSLKSLNLVLSGICTHPFLLFISTEESTTQN